MTAIIRTKHAYLAENPLHDFVKIPNDLKSYNLSATVHAAYHFFLMHEQEGSALPDAKKLAEELRYSIRTAERAIHTLIAAGLLITAEGRKS